MNTVVSREIKWLPASDLLSLSLLFDSLNAVTLHCCHLCLIPLKVESGVNFAAFSKLDIAELWLNMCRVYVQQDILYNTLYLTLQMWGIWDYLLCVFRVLMWCYVKVLHVFEKSVSTSSLRTSSAISVHLWSKKQILAPWRYNSLIQPEIFLATQTVFLWLHIKHY